MTPQSLVIVMSLENRNSMNIFLKVILAILVFLAISSGLTKIMLMQQDVDFFGKYGFSDPILIGFGLVQVLGGILLLVPKSRIIGALMVAVTFLISAAVLAMSGKLLMAIITTVCIALLGLFIKQSGKSKDTHSIASKAK